MADQLAASMKAPERADDDIPEFTDGSNSSVEEEEEEMDVPIETEESEQKTKRAEIAKPSAPVQSTYRPSYMPPAPSDAPKAKPKIKTDLSDVHAGTVVKHKAYGPGTIKAIDGAVIIVTFNGIDKKFQYPGGFENGFLSLDAE